MTTVVDVDSTDRSNQEVFEALRTEWYGETDGLVARDAEFARLTDEWRAVEWRSGGRTLLAALGLQYQEVPLCRGLAWLLDPQGGHGLGRHFLDAFLASLDPPIVDDSAVKIRVEESRNDTRADIVITVGEKIVVIEAKVHAGEQRTQADRLHENWDARLVFLTRSGYVPDTAKKSAGRWQPRTWREVAQLAIVSAEGADRELSAGARELIETLWTL